jgi:hypothetical protein
MSLRSAATQKYRQNKIREKHFKDRKKRAMKIANR